MQDIDIKKHLIVPLDFPSAVEAMDTVKELEGVVDYLKVGKQLFTAAGPDFVRELLKMGFKVFLDLKFHDIPNTVASAGIEAARLGVDMFNIHVSGGRAMMETTAEKVKSFCEENSIPRPIILGVTVLTSLSSEDLNEIGYRNSAQEQVRLFCKLAKASGLDGVVASAGEVKIVKEECGKDFITVTPGIRPLWAAADDQKRIVTPRKAIEAGSDYIVVGRPVTRAKDKKEAVRRLLED
jgi:orotidine-5'-phosphate decarboxylase